MTLLEWQRAKRAEGTYGWIQDRLKEITGKSYTVKWIMQVIHGQAPPGRDMMIALMKLSGLTIEEMAAGYNERQAPMVDHGS